jgi:hypothetical protein
MFVSTHLCLGWDGRPALTLYDSDSPAAEAALAEKLAFDYVAAGGQLFSWMTTNTLVMLAAVPTSTRWTRHP